MAGPTDKQLEYVARKMYKRAHRGLWRGYERELMGAYFQLCCRTVFGTNLIFTRDKGWKTTSELGIEVLSTIDPT